MDLNHVTFAGPPFDENSEIIASLPDNLIGLLRQINGFILFDGGLHVRGVCTSPAWHSLTPLLVGATALNKLYPVLRGSDVPFAQDCVADQYVLRDRSVHKLWSETGEMNALGLSLPEFFTAVQSNPVEFLGMQPLLRHQRESGPLQPGQVLHAYPPFCTKEAGDGVSLKAVPASDAISYLADFARQISGLASGEQIRVTF